MMSELKAGFGRDLARWTGSTRRPSTLAAALLIIWNPGVQAVLLLRVQLAFQSAGRFRRARVVSLVNLRLTGAEFLLGCAVAPGLVMRHPLGIVIGAGAVIGEDCTILQRVTLGERYGDGSDIRHEYPRVGSRVVIGAGAAILGGVEIGDDAIIGANAVVVRDVEPAAVAVGVPAKSIRKAGDVRQV